MLCTAMGCKEGIRDAPQMLHVCHRFSSFLIAPHRFSSFVIVSHNFSLFLIVFHLACGLHLCRLFRRPQMRPVRSRGRGPPIVMPIDADWCKENFLWIARVSTGKHWFRMQLLYLFNAMSHSLCCLYYLHLIGNRKSQSWMNLFSDALESLAQY